jgi:CBS domain-containing protein
MPKSGGIDVDIFHHFLPKDHCMENQSYRILPHSTLKSEAAYHLPDQIMPPHVNANSAAVDVMTDLRRISTVTVVFDVSIDDANQKMIAHGVRTLIVVDEVRNVIGIVTSTDILGEKSMQFTHQRGSRHAEILVRDVMTSASRMEVIALKTIFNSRVGDVLETLKRSRRQHALVVDDANGTRQIVVGIFSSTQIARQLGLVPDPPETGHTFSEIETAIGA